MKTFSYNTETKSFSSNPKLIIWRGSKDEYKKIGWMVRELSFRLAKAKRLKDDKEAERIKIELENVTNYSEFLSKQSKLHEKYDQLGKSDVRYAKPKLSGSKFFKPISFR